MLICSMCFAQFTVQHECTLLCRAVARALIGGGGGVYSYIRVLPD